MHSPKIIALLFLLLCTACTNSSENTDFDKGPMLENIATNLVVSSYSSSLASFKSLDSALNILEKNNTELNLALARNLWGQASNDWAKTVPYHFGPIDELLIENSFHYFPTDTIKLQSVLQKFEGDENFIRELGSDTRGLGALEFLLFSEKSTLNQSNIAFAKMISSNLLELNQEILTQWKSTYAKAFASNTGSGINSGITLLTNQWIEVAEKIKNDKIGIPSGKMTGANKRVGLLQAPVSKHSLDLIKANLIALKDSFNGGKGKGVDDYLDALDIRDKEDQLLSDKINQQFNLLLQLTNEESRSLSELIRTDAEKLDRIYLEVLNLTILLKTDMMGQLGLITTFSDSDGD